MREKLSFPPFPDLYDTGLSSEGTILGWQATIVLKTWADFRAEPDYWYPESMSKVSNGTVDLGIGTIDELTTPSPEQCAAYQYLIENEETLHRSVLQGIFEEYPITREAYGYDEPMFIAATDSFEDPMPDIQYPDDLKMLIGLDNVGVSRFAKDGFAYLIFQFKASWDPEHPFEVTTHKERVVMVSSADGDYHAKRDAQTG